RYGRRRPQTRARSLARGPHGDLPQRPAPQPDALQLLGAAAALVALPEALLERWTFVREAGLACLGTQAARGAGRHRWGRGKPLLRGAGAAASAEDLAQEMTQETTSRRRRNQTVRHD